jgi:hypothetical protein
LFIDRPIIAHRKVISLFINLDGYPLSGSSLYHYVKNFGMEEANPNTSMSFIDTRHMSTTHFFQEIENENQEEQIRKIKNRCLVANHSEEIMKKHYNDYRIVNQFFSVCANFY